MNNKLCLGGGGGGGVRMSSDPLISSLRNECGRVEG